MTHQPTSNNSWLRLLGLALLLSCFTAFTTNAQNVSVTGGTTASGSYATLAAALTAVNAAPATGPITVTINAGYSETAPATGLTVGSATLNPTLSATNTLTITKTGGTVTLNAGVGTATPGSAAPDGILKLTGADFVTIDGLTFTDGNTTNPATMEYGVALFKLSAGDGAHDNTIQNCTFNMQRVNNASGTSPMVEGSVGILVINSTATAATTSLTPTNGGTSATNGTNSNNKFYSNTINGGNYGIVLNGFAATSGVGPAPTATTFLGDLNNDIGGASSGTGNTILNFGGAPSATNPSAGIRANNQWGVNISYNTINNNNGSGVNHVSTLRGIYAQAGTSGNATINNNTVTVNSGASSSALTAIENGIGSTAASNTININNNIVQNCTYSTSTTGTFSGIVNSASAATVNINNNQVINNTIAGTGTNPMISVGSPTTVTCNNNTITGNNRTSSTTGTQRGIIMTSPTNATFSGNTIANMSFTNTASTGNIDGIYGFSSSVNVTITNNVIRDLSTPTTGTINGIREFGISGTKTIQNNQVYNFSTTAGGAGGATFNGIYCSTGNIEISNNQVYSLNSTGTTGGTGGTVYGVQVSGGTTNNIFKNRICNLSSTSTNPVVGGITLSGGTTNTVSNNRIGDLNASAANAANPLIGINISGGTTANVYYNTVNLNGTSSGAVFGSSALSASTTPTLNLNNNILVNTSTPNGSGLTVAYRRSSTSLTSYGSGSNRNLFYAGTPGTNRLIFFDGTNSDQTLVAYQARVTTRDAASISEVPNFLSTTCGNANFLKVNTTLATGIESGGANIAGITDDFENDVRQGNPGYAGTGTAPDIGADEFNGTPLAVCAGTPATATITGSSAVCSGSGTTLGLSVTYTDLGITYLWASSSTSGGPYTNLGSSATQSTGPLTSTTYYICTVTCTNSGQTMTTTEFSVNINALPTVSISPSSSSVCAPGGTASALTASGASTYSWSPAAGLNATTGATVNALPGSTTTYTVTGTDGNGCTGTATTSVAVNPAVSVSSLTATPNPACSGGDSQLNAVAGTTATYSVASTTYGLISGTGTALSTGDDAILGTVTLPFSFSFFGVAYNTIYVHSNGFVSFSAAQGTAIYSETLPTANTTNNLIAICKDDLNVTGGASVTTFTSGVTPNRVFVINWSGVKFYNSSSNNGDMSGQIQLFERDNHIEVHVTSSNDPSPSAHAIGIENAAGTVGYAPAGRNNVTYSFTNTTPEAWAFYPNGGSPTYSWSPATFLNNTAISNPLAQAMTSSQTYTVTASSGGCSGTASITISVGDPLSTTASASSASVCDGQTVNLSATPTGGGAPYTYVWNDGGSDIGFTSPFTYDPDDSRTTTFTVTVTDACGSTATATVDVTSNAVPVVNVSGGTLICGTGSVTLTADGANTYVWTPGGSTTNPLTASPTSTTTYTVVGTDGNGCTASNTWVVNVASPVTSPTASASPNPACDGATVNFSSNATVSGYSIGSGGTTYTDISTSGTAVTGTPSDDSEHQLTISPFIFNGVSYTDVRIGNNGKLVLGATTGDVGYSNVALPYPLTGTGATTAGYVALMPYWDDLTPGTGASIRYQTIGSKLYIQWTNEDHFSAPGTGTITFQVQLDYTDGKIYFVYPDVDFVGPPTLSAVDRGGSATVGLQFSASSFLQYSFNTQSLTNGQVISFTPNSPTSFSWTGPSFGSGQQNPSITGATASNSGTYTVTMTSNEGCTATASVSLVVDNPINASCVATDAACFGGNGSVTVSATGGDGSFTGTGTFNVPAGTYSYTVTDGLGCTASCSATVGEPAQLVASCSATDAACFGGNGSIAVSATGGTTPYTGTGTFSVVAGTYNYTVTDNNGCTSSCSATVNEPAQLVASCSATNPACFGGTGSITVSAVGGTAPYSGDGVFSGLGSGNYNYTVTDNNGCTSSCSATITVPSQLIASCTPTNESAPGANDGSVLVAATGGTAPYTGDGNFTGLAAGNYNYTVTDNNGCTASCSATVGTNCVPSTDPTGASASAANICLGNNVTLSVVGGSLGTGANWVWYAGACGAGAPIGTGASFSYTPPSAGTYSLFVRAEGLCGTTTCATVTVVVSSGAPTGTISITSAPISGCVGGSDVITTNAVLGATGYNWSGPPQVLFNGQPSPYISATNSVTVSYTALPTGGQSGWNICVQAVNACGASPNTKCTWIRATLTQPSAISGSIIACPSSSGTYSIPAVAGATSYQWTATGTDISVSGTGTSATVTFGPGFTSGTLCVSGVTSCGYVGASRCMTISTAPVIPGTISGPNTICPGGSASFSIAAVPGAASYIWSATGAGVSVVGSGTSATVTTTTGFTAGSVCVVAVSSCGSPVGNSPQRCKTISTGKLGTPGNITGDPTNGVCGQTYTYSIPALSGATSYTWTLPAGATGSSSTNSITVTFSGGFTSGQICVNGNNACGAGFQRCVTVNGNPANVTGLTTSTPAPCAGTDILVTWNATNGASTYEVFVPTGYTVLTGSPTTNTFAIVNVGAANGSIGIRANSGCGNSGTATLAITPVGCRVAGSAEVNAALRTEVFPNPTTGTVNIRFNSDNSDMQYVVNVTDLSGRVVLSERKKANQGSNLHTLDLSGMAKGTYLVSLLTDNGKEVVRVTVE